MAQLSDDCFAFGGTLLGVDAAARMIADQVKCVAGTETVPLLQADGRVLAQDLIASVDLPPFDNSAVDGYAVRLADLDATADLPLAGRLAAGTAPAATLAPGTTLRIFTGAVLPEGADTVFMQEDVRVDDKGRVNFPGGLRRGANTRRRGEDVASGARALSGGTILRPQDLALAAALGLPHLPVRRALRVAVFSTGDELVEPGVVSGAAQRYDSNRVLVTALLRRTGAVVSDLGILPDRPDTTASALSDAALSHDLLLTTGGVSTGEEDHVRAAIEATGGLTFWRLAIKPGRPVAMGVAAGVPFIGLPGNPVAAFVTYAHVVRPMLAALSGATPPAPQRLRVLADFSHRKRAGRREYVRVRLLPGSGGMPLACKHPIEGAGILTSLTRTDGLAELGEDTTAVAPGDAVAYLPYELLW